MDWDRIYRQHHSDVIGYLLVRTRNSPLAQDLAQDVFVRAMRCEGQWRYDDGRGIGPWLTTIARNLLLDHLKRGITRYEEPWGEFFPDSVPAVASAEDEALSLEDQVLVVAREAAVRRAVDGLSREQRAAVRLFYWEDCPDTQIARRMDRGVGAVKTLKYRARANLRRDLAGVA